jgi:hypothetical protein
VLERFPTLSSRLSSSENALALCFGEHLYPTDDLVWSDDALTKQPLHAIVSGSNKQLQVKRRPTARI